MSGSADTPAAGSQTATPSTSWVSATAASAAGWATQAAASAGWKPQLPYRVRPKPRAYGTGRYGVDKYDSRDDSRYAWSRIAPALALLVGLFSIAAPARAVNAYCESADALTPVFGFCKPSVDVEGATPWGTKNNANFDLVETSLQGIGTSTQSLQVQITATGASTAAITAILTAVGASTQTNAGLIGMATGQLLTLATTYVNVTGDTMTGPLTVPNIVGPTTVTGASVTVVNAWLGQTSSSAPLYYVGTNGSASAPSLAGPQTNTGILFSGTDMLFTANGTTRGSVVTGIGLCGGTGATSGQGCLRSSAGDKTDPAFQFAGDANTGFYRSAADDWRLVAGGVEIVRLQSDQVNLMPFTMATATMTANGFSTGSSVTASAFFGDGSHLSGISGAIGGLTASYIPRATGSSSLGNGGFYDTGSSVTATTPVLAGSSFTASGMGMIDYPYIGGPSTTSVLNTGGGLVYRAFSEDGATQSSGCLVATTFRTTTGADTASMVFTSTTTQLSLWGVGLVPGVLLESCAPKTYCAVGLGGVYRVIAASSVTQYVANATTRCQVANDNANDAFRIGSLMQTSCAAAGGCWIHLTQ